jgi:transposase
MHRFIDGEDRLQQALLPHSLEDYVGEENPVRVIEVFIDELDLAALGFSGMTPAATGRPAYHPSTLLKIYLYGYLNRLQSSRRLEREAQRNIELMWLVGRLAPDFKTIADFRKDNGAAIQSVCRQFVELCRRLKLFTGAVVAIDGSKFKAVNNRDKNYTVAKVTGRMEQVDASIVRYLRALDRAGHSWPARRGRLTGGRRPPEDAHHECAGRKTAEAILAEVVGLGAEAGALELQAALRDGRAANRDRHPDQRFAILVEDPP